MRILVAHSLLYFAVGTRQRAVYDDDLVIDRVAIGLVEIESLLDDGLVVLVKGNA